MTNIFLSYYNLFTPQLLILTAGQSFRKYFLCLPFSGISSQKGHLEPNNIENIFLFGEDQQNVVTYPYPTTSMYNVAQSMNRLKSVAVRLKNVSRRGLPGWGFSIDSHCSFKFILALMTVFSSI